jgi:hypothetical protein
MTIKPANKPCKWSIHTRKMKELYCVRYPWYSVTEAQETSTCYWLTNYACICVNLSCWYMDCWRWDGTASRLWTKTEEEPCPHVHRPPSSIATPFFSHLGTNHAISTVWTNSVHQFVLNSSYVRHNPQRKIMIFIIHKETTWIMWPRYFLDWT